MSPTHSWLCGVVVKTPDRESVQIQEFFCFCKEQSSLISQILNTRSEKHDSVDYSLFSWKRLLRAQKKISRELQTIEMKTIIYASWQH